ncbi:antiviral reverse transcriptase Drt3a [Pseudomonas sp. 5P_5.1_Bac1]|uniref:antiviral reverse transcriptase Drt3a n=1 Tax=Pseudomonas sp. 5P_5.1_Bac1 TaxID=2971616 RepID=UPI0021C77859|nr:antiviral reverse transcriptase Drt3a [Pseudomonas sp. 5P_5.1_Bac1]MCU1723384.1 RNA-directed DNA polymerase [Pseudomonas sp. 5P_5.1_Bac1]
MLNQNFSPENLKKFLHSKRDVRKLKKQNNGQDEHSILTNTSYEIDSSNFTFKSLSSSILKNKKIVRIRQLKETIILRKLNDNLKRIYGVKQSNRREITKQVFVLLKEPNPLYIVRLDIKSFFESMDLNRVLLPITQETLLSPTSKKIINALRSNPVFPLHIPRGINISSTLSEIHMRKFDHIIKNQPGVYYYARYVDDIIIFLHKDFLITHKLEIYKHLPDGLKTHRKKSKFLPINCRCEIKCVCVNNCRCRVKCDCLPDPNKDITLDYLGYNFKFSDIPKIPRNTSSKNVVVTLASRKVKRIKTRITLALLDHIKTPNFSLLKNRLLFLTGNCEFNIKGEFKIRSGIYYNYPLLNHNDPALLALTTYLRKAVHSKKGPFGKALSNVLINTQRSELGRLSFISGFKNKITYKMSEEKLSAIKECWKNA